MTYRITSKFNSFTSRVDLKADNAKAAMDRMCEMVPMTEIADQVTVRRL